MRGTRAEMRERAAALQRARVSKARTDFPAFLEYCFYDEARDGPVRSQWFHDEWAESMEREPRLIIVAPRNHGKTTVVVAYITWRLGREPNLRVKVVCATDARAKERLYEIKQHITDNPRVREVFPEMVADDTAEWSKHKVVLKRNARHRDASVEALGITSTITGGRADLLVADDVVDRRNALAYPALRREIKRAWKADWSNILEPGSGVIYICTPWHKDDLSHELMDNPAYRLLTYEVGENFETIWPEKWSSEELKERRVLIGSIDYNRAFRNRAHDESTAPVRPEWFRYADPPDGLDVVTSYDTATGLKKTHDYTASVTIGVGSGRIHVLEAWHDRLSLKEQARRVDAEFETWSPHRVLLEKVGQASLDQWIRENHPRVGPFLELIKPREGKTSRLLEVTPLLESGAVTFSPHLDPDSPRFEPGRGNLVEELLDFPIGKHDDLVDAFSQALRWCWHNMMKSRRGGVRVRVLAPERTNRRRNAEP